MWKRVSVDALGHHGPGLGQSRPTTGLGYHSHFRLTIKANGVQKTCGFKSEEFLIMSCQTVNMAAGGRWVKLDGKFQFGYGRESKNQIGTGPSLASTRYTQSYRESARDRDSYTPRETEIQIERKTNEGRRARGLERKREGAKMRKKGRAKRERLRKRVRRRITRRTSHNTSHAPLRVYYQF